MSWGVLGAVVVVAVALVVASGASRRTGIPYPVFLVVAGLLISTIPEVAVPALRPGIVFYGFLPPLVYSAAFLASPSEFAANWASIGLLAVVLVLATTVAVAASVHGVAPGFGWPSAFVLGAVVAPTDPVAAGEVIRRVGAPRRLVTILEGESLINDGVALALYGLAVSAAGTVGVTVLGGVATLFAQVGISLGIGLGVGALARVVRRRAGSGEAQVVLSLVTPYVAYLAADHLSGSGVLATVVAGLYVGWRTEGLVPAPARLRTMTFWEVLTYLLNATLFVLLGARFATVVRALAGFDAAHVALDTATAVLAVVLLRLAWVLAVPRLTAGIAAVAGRPARREPLAERLLVGWSGMRGAVSLAAALAVPLRVDGHPFPGRPLIVFVTFAVILATLVAQGGSLPAVITRLGLAGGGPERRELSARVALARAALTRLDELVADAEAARARGGCPRLAAVELAALRGLYERRLERAAAALEVADEGGHETAGEEVVGSERRLDEAWREAIGAARAELHRLERKGEVDNETVLELQRELDLEEARHR